MTLFIDLRALRWGGDVAAEAKVRDELGRIHPASDLEDHVRGRELVLATHGFNVDRRSGMLGLGAWEGLCSLPGSCAYVGVLWPGDSRFLPILDYPAEGAVAMQAGRLLAPFLATWAASAASISFASHSLGARMVLECMRHLQWPVRVLVLMAGAIEDDCLTREYALEAARAGRIRVVASLRDFVLAAAFPLGDTVGDFLRDGHPYYRPALGRRGPRTGVGLEGRSQTWQVPDRWDYGHLDYLPGRELDPPFPPPLLAPEPLTPVPRPQRNPWKPSWSGGVIGTQFH